MESRNEGTKNAEYGKKAEEGEKESGEANSQGQENQPALPLWTCDLEGRVKTEALTVGEVFQMDCKGPNAEILSADLQFKDKRGKQYKIRILEVLDESENNLQLKAVSYRPGHHKFKELVIVDQGQPVVRIEPLDFKVKSVLKNPMQEPYGPVTAMKLSYPSWLWMVFVFPLVVVILGLLFWWRRKFQMLRVIEKLKKHDTALGAFNQFNKDMRLLERQSVFKKNDEWSISEKQSYTEELDHIFRLYLLREFYIPALEWSSGLITRTLSRQDKRFYKFYGSPLKKLLKELDRAKKSFSKLKDQDFKQLGQMAKKVSQLIWREKRGTKK